MDRLLSIFGPAKAKIYELWLYNNKRAVTEGLLMLLIILIGIEVVITFEM